jgi:hypothetical protein
MNGFCETLQTTSLAGEREKEKNNNKKKKTENIKSELQG